ncbi:MAG: MATE family efflux transporter [Pseudomonadota bacterium]
MAERDLTKGPVWRALASVSAPMTLGILAVLSVGIADSYFLGQLGGAPLAAVGFVYPIITALSSLAIGLSAGANAAVSQAIGRKDDTAAVHRLSLHAVGISLALSAAIALLLAAIYPFVFQLMGAGEAVMKEIRGYMPLWALSFPLLGTIMVINAIFRAHGDAALASIFMILAAVINIALNPVFIFGLGPIEGMETAGAALATLVARSLALAAAVIYALRKGYLRKCGTWMQDFGHSLTAIASIGGPAAFSNAINPAGMALVTAAVAKIGEPAVAGFGAASRVQSVAMVVMLALSSGMGPVVGQNWGAGKHERARSAVVQAWAFSVVYGLILAVALTLLAKPLATLVVKDEEAASYMVEYLRIVGWSLFGYGILVTANAAMNARSKAFHATGLSLVRIFVIYLPLVWVGLVLYGYTGILVAAVIANLAAVLGAIYLCRRTMLLPAINDLRQELRP